VNRIEHCAAESSVEPLTAASDLSPVVCLDAGAAAVSTCHGFERAVMHVLHAGATDVAFRGYDGGHAHLH
jgi:hypothetical protein